MPAFPQKHSPYGATPNWGSKHPIAAYYSFIDLKGWKAELTYLVDYGGRFIHISGHPSATGREQDKESSLAKDWFSTTVPCNQPHRLQTLVFCTYWLLNLGQLVTPRASSTTSYGIKPLGISGMSFLWAGCPSCNPTISVKALKGTQCTNPNQWPGLILSSSITGLLREGVLLPSCQFSEASIFPAAQPTSSIKNSDRNKEPTLHYSHYHDAYAF